jgi:ATP-dependent helicase Lhr and Lhr-like helicase
MVISTKTKPNNEKDLYSILNPLMKKWFKGKFKEFAIPQKYSVFEIHSRKNILVSSPTGSGKTLTGFLSVLNELIDSSLKKILEDRIYCVYVSPLKALSQDVKKNLIEPLQELEKLHGMPLNIRVGVRTGDTTQKEKSYMLKNPPHIFITTPESLGIALTSPKFRNHLRKVEWFILDEVHALAENKRGVDLSLGMERLQYLSPGMTRVGLSATVAPLEEVAKFLAGSTRDCLIVDVQYLKLLDLKVLSPVPDLIDTTFKIMHDKMYKLIHDLISKHTTTLIFTNTRAATERVVHNLKEKYPSSYIENIGAHHGS